ncbi:murein biosynthesis integral membrane protein MurJ [Robiginitomaculum antarcticum]|uniref:murein biosynthesis integral membrane protein MurJ n=1 Tax=Robiginitomaculum antarcticum TaxID=437507 RepID=UPI0003634A51|nr:murein biosynthesis integral membrane protein MurJ [Robiginitomaculum antarcticum]
MTLLRSTAIIGFFTLVSRILGMARDILIARFLGAGPVTDALFTAFRLPNLFRRVFAEGAFNAAFVPLYARRLEERGQDAANDLAREALSVLLVAVAVIVVIFELTMPVAMNLLGAGLDRAPTAGDSLGALSPYDLAVLYAQITMPYLLFMSVAALFSGILNTKHYFAMAAAAPIALNIALLGVLLSAPSAQWSARQIGLYLCVAMSLSGIVQVAMVVWGCRRAGVVVGLRRPRMTPGVKRLLTLGVPGALAAGITQINLMVSHNIATTQASAPSWLNYADRLYQLPLGMIGIAMGVALLPAMTRSLRSGNPNGAMRAMNRAIEMSMALTLPAAFALAVMPTLLVAGLFQSGAFDAADTVQTAKALQMFALGLPAFVLIKILTPAFFSRENTKSPMIYAGVSAVVNMVFGAALFFTIGFYGLALATTIAAWVNVALLYRSLHKSKHYVPDAQLLKRLPRLILASAVMGAAIWVLAQRAEPILTERFSIDIFILLAVSTAGIIIYAIAALALRAVNGTEMLAALGRK